MDIYACVQSAYEGYTQEKRIIGKTALGRCIFAFKVGYGTPVGIAQYAMHAREWITALLALRHIELGVDSGCFWVIPLMNPDGAMLVQQGINSIKNARVRKRLIKINGGEDFSLWKANANGVDLNVNFNARWGTGAHNMRCAGAGNYIGRYPHSEKETRALAHFTRRISPNFTVSYHTKGEEIYWYFHQSLHTCPRDKRLAMALSASTGYPLRYVKNSAGGYKDWCIECLRIPAFTIEAGADALHHPIGVAGFENIRVKNENALKDLIKEYALGI